MLLHGVYRVPLAAGAARASVPKTKITRAVLRNFTASIARGEKIALLGRNGSGKTTMLKSLLSNATGFVDAPDRDFPIDSGVVTWGMRGL